MKPTAAAFALWGLLCDGGPAAGVTPSFVVADGGRLVYTTATGVWAAFVF